MKKTKATKPKTKTKPARREPLPASGLFWHVHHDRVAEYCWNSRLRVSYIKLEKPEWEKKKRLALMRPIKNPPAGLLEALEQARVYSWIMEHPIIMRELHAQECGCDFYKNLGDIFSRSEYRWCEASLPARVKKKLGITKP